MLSSARLDSCLFKDCGTDGLSSDDPPTWAGACASLDGESHVQTTDIDFTVPGPAGRAAAERSSPAAATRRPRKPRPAAPGSDGGGRAGGASPSTAVEGAAELPTEQSSGHPRGAADPQEYDGGLGRTGDVVLESRKHGSGPVLGTAQGSGTASFRPESSASLFSVASSSKAMSAASMVLSAVVLALFVALMTRCTHSRRRQRRGGAA